MKKQKESFTFINKFTYMCIIYLFTCVLYIYFHVDAIKKYIFSQTLNEKVMSIPIWRDAIS